jgi:hypothetical protein
MGGGFDLAKNVITCIVEDVCHAMGPGESMSTNVKPYLVDWRTLQATRKTRGRYDDWFAEAVKNEPWLSDYGASCETWIGVGGVWADVGLAYDELREEIDARTRKECDRFLRSFLVGEEEHRMGVREAPGEDKKRPFFHLSMSPVTVKSYAQMARAVPLGKLRAAFEEAVWVPEPDTAFMNSFDRFEEYLRQWTMLFQVAAKEGKGLLVTVH